MSDEQYDQAMAVRREVLGEQHVDRAESTKNAFTEDFQELITRYAWGGIWTRPGLDRRMRSAVTLTALVAHGHWEELALHLVAARRNGLTSSCSLLRCEVHGSDVIGHCDFGGCHAGC